MCIPHETGALWLFMCPMQNFGFRSETRIRSSEQSFDSNQNFVFHHGPPMALQLFKKHILHTDQKVMFQHIWESMALNLSSYCSNTFG